MATATKREEQRKESPVNTPQPEPTANKDVRVVKNRKRVSGTLAKPIYLIHDGTFEVKVPAITREVVVDDPDDERFADLDPKPEVGDVVHEVVVPETTVKDALPKDSRYGRLKIGVAYEITDVQEAKDLRRRGFREATEAEIEASGKAERRRSGGKTIDEIAAEQREKAQANFRRTTRGAFRARRDDDNE